MSNSPRITRAKVRLGGWRLAVARTGLVACGLVFTLLLLEAGLRLVDARIPTSTVLSAFFEFDPVTGWRGKPNAQGRFVTANFDSTVSHDADGWRRTELTASIDDDAHATQAVVWCVGDSMTWGWGVSDGETFVDHLNRQAGRGTRFRNLGIPGYSAVQEYLLLKQQFELGRRPDHVVVFFCPNDWEGNLAEAHRDPAQPRAGCHDDVWAIEGIPVPKTFGWTVRSWLRQNSQAFGFLNYYYKRAQHWNKNRSSPEHFLAPVHEPTETEQRAMRFVYGEVQKLCREHHVEFTVATDFQPHPVLESICRDLEIELIGAFQQMPPDDDPQTVPPDRALTFATDPHWTPYGHRLVARAIRDGLVRSPAMARSARDTTTR